MNDLIDRLRKRAEIRRQIPSRRSVQEGEPDRIADLLEEAADALERRQWVGLTDAERFYCNEYPVDDCCSDSVLRAEALLKDKNT